MDDGGDCRVRRDMAGWLSGEMVSMTLAEDITSIASLAELC